LADKDSGEVVCPEQLWVYQRRDRRLRKCDQFSVNKGVRFHAAFYNKVVPRAPNFAGSSPLDSLTPACQKTHTASLLLTGFHACFPRISSILNAAANRIFRTLQSQFDDIGSSDSPS
jgi:hypothetical protein